MPLQTSFRFTWRVVLVWCALLSASWAQDLYRQPGLWLDDRARPFELTALRGRPTVLTMAYGACRRVCATSLRVMTQLQSLADERGLDLNFVVVGLSPEQDTPADWAQLRAERHLERANWQFLSGDEGSTRRLARRLAIRYWRYGEHTLHDFRIVMLSDDGRLIRQLDAADQPLASLLP